MERRMIHPGFEATFDDTTGAILGIRHPGDSSGMNWAEGDVPWGLPALFPQAAHLDSPEKIRACLFRTVSVEQDDTAAAADGAEDCRRVCAVYEKNSVRVTALRVLEDDGSLRETYEVENLGAAELFLREGELGIFTPFNDDIKDARTSLRSRCHTHLWCGGGTSYVNAVRMSTEPPHLGLVLTEGALQGYSVFRETKDRRSADRGDFVLNPAPVVLAPKASFRISWRIFFHDGDFFAAMEAMPDTLHAEADRYVLAPGESAAVTARYSGEIETAAVTMDGTHLPYRIEGRTLRVVATPLLMGEKTLTVTVNRKTAILRLLVTHPFETLLRARTDFIVRKQQFHREGSPLDGAFLIYDKECDRMHYDSENDHNGGRERLAMGVALACRLQLEAACGGDAAERGDPGRSGGPFGASPAAGGQTASPQELNRLKAALIQYVEYVRRELYDPETGIVSNDVRRNNAFERLYNYPWMAILWLEMFQLTGDRTFLTDAHRTLCAYYAQGGRNFYAIGIPVVESVTLMRNHGLAAEAETLLAHFSSHADRLIEHGLNYPAHEVEYEQSIVAPAVSILLQVYELTGRADCLQEAERQLKVLRAFSFRQPDYHLNDIAIRHWDGYWFGKRRLFGDTFPHYWSVLSGDVEARHAAITGCEAARRTADRIFMNNLCLFELNGFASCAHLYPLYVNGERGSFYDPWANDQDWALYFAFKWRTRGG